jgi:hypothetical protein
LPFHLSLGYKQQLENTKTQEGAKHYKQNRHTRVVRKSNTALCGNQVAGLGIAPDL